jgi:hypothetical protein
MWLKSTPSELVDLILERVFAGVERGECKTH